MKKLNNHEQKDFGNFHRSQVTVMNQRQVSSLLKQMLQGIWLLFCFVGPEWVATQDIHFEHITIDDGLSQNSINCMLQDNKGFLWFGTQDGLNRYDGIKFKIIKNDPNDINSLSSNCITALHQDSAGILWIGTFGGGLNRFDVINEKFTRFLNEHNDPNSLIDNTVNAIMTDQLDYLWIGTRNGLDQYNLLTKEFTHHLSDLNSPNGISNNDIKCFYIDNAGVLWVGTANGINRFDRSTNQFKKYLLNSDIADFIVISSICEVNKRGLYVGSNKGIFVYDNNLDDFKPFECSDPQSKLIKSVMVLHPDKNNNLWIGSGNNGLFILDLEKDKLSNYRHNPQNVNSLSNDGINAICEDLSGVFWLGTTAYGINKYYYSTKEFVHFHNNPERSYNLLGNAVFGFIEDSQGILWIGTFGGMNEYDRNNNEITHYTNDSNNEYSINSGMVFSIYEDPDEAGDFIWLGTYGGGINKFDRKNNKFIHYTHDPENENSISSNIVYRIIEDYQGILWLGTTKGLNRFDRSTGNFKSYINDPQNPNSISSDYVYYVLEDSKKRLWAATADGLNIFDRETEQFQRFMNDPNDYSSLSNNRIYSVFEDSNDTIWIATQGGGLNKYNEDSTFERFTKKDGLSNNSLYGILEDENGNLWISTNRGLSKFNVANKEFKNYFSTDGLQSNEFNTNAFFKSKSGEMFFGGINGFNSFFPANILDNQNIPPVVFTNFQLFNQNVPIGTMNNGRTLLTKSISETPEIKLNYSDRIFAFEFAALDYVAPENNEYMYLMEGIENEWIGLGNKNYISFHTLPPKKYTLRIKASNNDGVWNEEGASIKVTILPPFWKTGWFRVLIAVFIVGTAFSWYKMRVRNLERQKQRLEKQVKERTKEIQEKNEQILSSIRYGERIQNAILPLTEKIRSSLSEHFILFKPRDIVSGDFYWFNQINGKTVLAVVDCTGHGVPGAFMSMLGNAFLNEIVLEHKILNPTLILKQLHLQVRSALKQEQERTKTQDGMDVCLCVLEKNSHKHKVLFAGAKRPLYIIKEGETDLTEIKGDRKSIGGRQREEERVFTAHELSLQSGDKVYLTTDGFADQQNVGNRRYGSGRLKTFLQRISILEMQEQEKVLAQELARHQGREEQRDDITVVGVKV